MRFWDTSAIVPLLVTEAGTPRARALAAVDSDMLVWWGARIESVTALSRLDREGTLERATIENAFARLARLADRWDEIEPNEFVRDSAIRFLRVHPLRAADALQLAAAFVASDHRPASLPFVTFDERLSEAAQKEGFVLTS